MFMNDDNFDVQGLMDNQNKQQEFFNPTGKKGTLIFENSKKH